MLQPLKIIQAMLYNFKQWDHYNSLNEGKSMKDILNWFGSFFGGSLSKIDSYLEDIVQIEEDYTKEWDKVVTEIDSLQVQKAQISNDPAESRKLDRMIERNERLLNSMLSKKNSSVMELEEKVKKIVDKDSKLVSYWNLKKTEAEKEIAERLYDVAKKLTDPDLGEELYDKYKQAALIAKQKDEDFRKKYGDMKLPSSSLVSSSTTKKSPKYYGQSKLSKDSLNKIMSYSGSEFEKYAEELSKEDAKDLIRELTRVKNEMCALRDLDLEKFEDEAKRKGMSEAQMRKEIRDLRNYHTNKIGDLRTKITLARRYD